MKIDDHVEDLGVWLLFVLKQNQHFPLTES